MRSNSSKQLGRSKRGKWQPGQYLLDPACANGPIDPAAIYPRGDQPLEVEVGIGKGTFLLGRARHRPDVNFLGIEYAASYAAYSADRIRRAGLDNARVIAADAMDVFTQALADASCRRVHIYFPDPWPKKRHHRRRLIQPPFIAQAVRCLEIGGQLLIVTDHRGYFQQIRSLLSNWPGLASCSFPSMLDEDEGIVGTNFEKKYARQGKAFHQLARLKYRR
jgi:tRNA (guanine-N7-)-methyltransferase